MSQHQSVPRFNLWTGNLRAENAHPQSRQPVGGAGPIFKMARVVSERDAPRPVLPDYLREAREWTPWVRDILADEAVKDALDGDPVPDQEQGLARVPIGQTLSSGPETSQGLVLGLGVAGLSTGLV